MLTPSSSRPTLRLAIYRIGSFGDVVLATACLDLLSNISTVATEITWIGRGAALEVVKAAWPEVNTVEAWRSDSLADRRRIIDRLQNHHALVDLQCNRRSRLFCRDLKAHHGVPYFAVDNAKFARNLLVVEARVRGRRWPLPERACTAPRPQYERMCDALRRALHHHLPVEMLVNMGTATVRPRLPVSDAFDAPWRKDLRFGAWLGIAPGASHPTKLAPPSLMRTIVDGVQTGLARLDGSAPKPLGLAFFGDTNDRQVARAVIDELNWTGRVLNLAGRLSLWESAVALREVTCLLCNDSALAHIAEAVDTPVSVLFGPTVEGFGFGPRMRASRAFSGPLGCRPCSKPGTVSCRYNDKLCFATLNPDDVTRHVIELLVAPDARHALRGATRSGLPGGAIVDNATI